MSYEFKNGEMKLRSFDIIRKNKAKWVGKILPTDRCGHVVVLDYFGSREVLVRFLQTGYETTIELSQLLKGSVKDRMLPDVCGVGVVGDANTRLNGKYTKEYYIWKGMLERCYKMDLPSYKDCTVSDNFKYFPYFKEWCQEQIGFDQEGWHLDKDILFKGNKLYSEYNCVFVPREINNLLLKPSTSKESAPVGISYHKKNKQYQSNIGMFGKTFYLGSFKTKNEAFFVYKEAKEAYIKELATKWRSQIDLRAYNALMSYQVEITE